MSAAVYDALYDEVYRFVTTPSENPRTNAQKRRMVRVLVDTTPEVREELVNEGQLKGERVALRRVLALRRLALSPARRLGSTRAPISTPSGAGTTRRSSPRALPKPSVRSVATTSPSPPGL